MNARNDDNFTSDGAFFCGLLTGITFGGLLAMLYAPRAGAELRRNLTDGATDLGRAAKDTWQDVTTTATDAAQKGLEAFDRASGAARNVADSASQSLDRVKATVKSAADQLTAAGAAFPRPSEIRH